MLDLDKIRTVVVKGLQDYLGIPVIRSNQTGKPPAYPYLSYTITSLMRSNGGTFGKYEDGKERKPTTQTWSITAQSDNVKDAMNLAIKAHTWLDHVGKVYLNDNGVIVSSLTSVANRDNLLTIEYEYRNGFDVVFWLLNEVEDTSSYSGTIESVSIGDLAVEEQTVDELIELLEKRLGGDV